MIRVELGTVALVRVRLMYSPLWELTSSLRLLLHDPESSCHRPWLRWMRHRVDAELMMTLRPLVPQPHRFPDFLTPPPGARPRSLRSELNQLATLDIATVQAQLRDTGEWPPPPGLKRLLAGVDPLGHLVKALQAYWTVALAPVWPQVRRLLAADLAYRADDLAANGLHALMNRLHPTVSFDGQILSINTPRHEVVRRHGVHSVSLVPCVFAWPHAMAVVCEPNPVTVSYTPRGTAALWLTDRARPASPVVDLIGRSRASILAILELPVSASQVAEQTGLSLPTVSQHLTVLRRAGLISSRRSGRTVWSTRTPLGDELLATPTD